MGTVACSLCCAFFYPGALGLFVKTDDSRSGSGGPCSDPVGECNDPEASHIPQKGSEKWGWAVGHRKQQTRVLLVLCCFPSLLLQLQTEVCNLSFPNCWEEAAFSLWTHLQACMPSCHLRCRNLRKHSRPDVGRERCSIYWKVAVVRCAGVQHQPFCVPAFCVKGELCFQPC